MKDDMKRFYDDPTYWKFAVPPKVNNQKETDSTKTQKEVPPLTRLANYTNKLFPLLLPPNKENSTPLPGKPNG